MPRTAARLSFSREAPIASPSVRFGDFPFLSRARNRKNPIGLTDSQENLRIAAIAVVRVISEGQSPVNVIQPLAVACHPGPKQFVVVRFHGGIARLYRSLLHKLDPQMILGPAPRAISNLAQGQHIDSGCSQNQAR